MQSTHVQVDEERDCVAVQRLRPNLHQHPTARKLQEDDVGIVLVVCEQGTLVAFKLTSSFQKI